MVGRRRCGERLTARSLLSFGRSRELRRSIGRNFDAGGSAVAMRDYYERGERGGHSNERDRRHRNARL